MIDHMKKVKSLIQVDEAKLEFKVHRSSFTDPDILKMEIEKIFDKCWLFLGHESEVQKAGDFITRKVGGRSLIFNRDADGNINALFNTCPHRGALVCRDRHGNSKTFQCFYHAWTFNNKGDLIGQPGAQDSYPENFNQQGLLNLHKVPRLSIYRGFVFINYDKHAMELEEYLADAKEYLDLVVDQSELGMEVVNGMHEYSSRANWKLLVENSVDGYHAIPTHKTYFDYLAESNGNYNPPDKRFNVVVNLGNGHSVSERGGVSKWGRPVARWVPSWGETGKQEIEQLKQRLVERFGQERADRIAEKDRNMIIFPNLVINDIMAVTIRTIFPIEPGYMEVTQWALAPKEENEDLRERRLNNFLDFLGPGGFATPDDVEAIELCQEGFQNIKEVEWNNISKGMNKEVPTSKDELSMRVFWTRWNEMITQ
jgi:p-cumate 2,3-dioxygenase alpha subunit